MVGLSMNMKKAGQRIPFLRTGLLLWLVIISSHVVGYSLLEESRNVVALQPYRLPLRALGAEDITKLLPLPTTDLFLPTRHDIKLRRYMTSVPSETDENVNRTTIVQNASSWIIKTRGPANENITANFYNLFGRAFVEYLPQEHYIVFLNRTQSFSEFFENNLKESTHLIEAVYPLISNLKIHEHLLSDIRNHRNIDRKSGDRPASLPLWTIVLSPSFTKNDFLEKWYKCSLEHAQWKQFQVLDEACEESEKVWTTHRILVLRGGDELDPDQVELMLRTLSEWPEVRWIERRPTMKATNHFSRMIVQGSWPIVSADFKETDRLGIVDIHTQNPTKLNGSGMIVGCTDTGLAVEHSFFRQNDEAEGSIYILSSTINANRTVPVLNNQRKIAAYIYWEESDTLDGIEGHGTHVSGTLTGAPPVNNPMYDYRGIAYGAQLAFFDIHKEDILTTGRRMGNLHLQVPFGMGPNLYEKLYRVGARIQSNSWSDDRQGYSLDGALTADEFTFVFADSLLVFAAGNAGIRGANTIGEPSLAKNVLTVGASMSASSPHFEIYNVDTKEILISGTAVMASFGRPLIQHSISGIMRTMQLSSDLCNGNPDSQPTSSFTNLQGNIAIAIKPKECSYVTIAKLAQKAGAQAVLIFDDSSLGNFIDYNTQEDVSSLSISVLGLQVYEYSLLSSYVDSDFFTMTLYRTVSEREINRMAEFSSRGPTLDGRIKPDVVAPGGFLLSAYSKPDAISQDGILPMSGTSMATPIVAGLAVLVQEYFEKGHYPSGEPMLENRMKPSGALIKAMIVNSARRMNGIVLDLSISGASFQLCREIYPYIYQGHGRANLSNVLRFVDSPFSLFVDDQSSLANDETKQYSINITQENQELSVTLVYTDPPVAPGALSLLANSLVLTVIAPDQTVFYGNAYDSSAPLPDINNNVQKVILHAKSAGQYTIIVKAHQVVMESPQKYAIIYTVGGYSGNPCPEATSLSTSPSQGVPASSLSTSTWMGIGFGILAGLTVLSFTAFIISSRMN